MFIAELRQPFNGSRVDATDIKGPTKSMAFRRDIILNLFAATLALTSAAEAQGLLVQMFNPSITQAKPALANPVKPQSAQRKPIDVANPNPKAAPKKFVWKAPLHPPLPPTRPLGVLKEIIEDEEETKAASLKMRDVSEQQVPNAAKNHHDDGSLGTKLTSQASPPPNMSHENSPERLMAIIVRDFLRGPKDLVGRRIATGFSREDPDALRLMVEQSAGISISPVAVSWIAGLASLARGDIDGVLLGLGPKFSAKETEAVTLAGYQLIEIPIATAP